MRVYEHAEEKRIAEEKRKFGGMRRYEADKKSKINPILGLRSGREKSLRPKTSKGKSPRNLIQRIFRIARSGFYQTDNYNVCSIQITEQETKG